VHHGARIKQLDPPVLEEENVYSRPAGYARIHAPITPLPVLYYAGGTALSNALEELGMENDFLLERSSALARVLSNVESPEALALVTAAEMGKTMDLLYDSARMSAKAVVWLNRLKVRDLSFIREELPRILRDSKGRFLTRRGIKAQLRKLPRRLDRLARTWLGFRYGVMASYYDLVSWTDAADAEHGKRTRYTSRMSLQDSDSYDHSVSSNSFHASRKTFSWSRSTTVTAGAYVGLQDRGSFTAHGLPRLLTVGWELTPFSWVVDWFIDVSKRLAALETIALYPVLGTWTTAHSTIYRHHEWNRSARAYVDGNKFYQGINSPRYWTTEVATVVSRVANPSLSPLPLINVRLNKKKIGDALSLFQVNRRKMRNLL
jgi:hypothetical protein